MRRVLAEGVAHVRRAQYALLSTILALVLLGPMATAGTAETVSEQRAADALGKVRADPLALRAFLKRMPKGADLHSHLSGAIYAETHIRDAIEDELCIDTDAKAFAKSQPVMAGAQLEPVCEQDQVPATDLPKNQPLYNSLVDSFSMRGFVPAEGATAHDHFFTTFTRFGGTDPSHTGGWVDEVAARAAAQNVQYLELMVTPTWHKLNTITKDVAWSDDLKSLADGIIAKGLFDDIPAARAFLDEADTLRQAKGHCGQPEESAACKVEARYIYQVFRNTPKESVLAQALFGFELASVDPRVVGINLVGAEDDYAAMADYADHMRIFAYVGGLYPKVPLSLHAGELTLGLVPPEGLCCHVRQAVEIADTDRVGHGVDVMHEDDPEALLKDMAAKHVLVEINLTSNADVLGIKGKYHPFPTYRQFGVPVALSTDDEGIERIDLTNEYVRAVASYDLTYADLKQIVRASLEHSFLPGPSLWQERDAFTNLVAECRGGTAGDDQPSPSCAAFLKASEKAAQQWELEHRFRAFESGL
jgi:adenosine deaminase